MAEVGLARLAPAAPRATTLLDFSAGELSFVDEAFCRDFESLSNTFDELGADEGSVATFEVGSVTSVGDVADSEAIVACLAFLVVSTRVTDFADGTFGKSFGADFVVTVTGDSPTEFDNFPSMSFDAKRGDVLGEDWTRIVSDGF